MGLETRRALVVRSISAKCSYLFTYTFRVPVFTSARTPCPRPRRAADGGAIMDHGSPKGGPCVGDPLPPLSLASLFGFPCEVLFFFRSHIDRHWKRGRLESVEDVWGYLIIQHQSGRTIWPTKSHRSQPREEEKKAWGVAHWAMGRAVCVLLLLAVSFLTRHSSFYVDIEASAYGAEEYTQAEGVL